ncbi:MAG TPA: hypothetical protein PKM58_12055 [Pyrinomonadaceae bacterium]|nr:hypothetical protein [Pyrinomonadaceae bacterium]HNU07814.1 hypothetical protein [Pyrinomonadaceae bacterium]
MDLIKLLLILIGIVALLVVGYWLIGLIFGIFWLLVYAAVIGLVGYGGYKLLFGSGKRNELDDGDPFALDEFDRSNRELEEIRRKFLTK